MGRQKRQTRRSIRTPDENGGGKSPGQPNSRVEVASGESEPTSLSADDKSGVKRASNGTGSTNKKTKRLPVVVLENLQESELSHVGSKKSSKSKRQAQVNDDKPRNGRSVRKQRTLTNSSDVEKCVSGRGQSKRRTTKSTSGASTQVDNGDIQSDKESSSKRKGARRKRTYDGGQASDRLREQDSDFDDDGQTNSMVKKVKTSQELVEDGIHDTGKVEAEGEASSSEAELAGAPRLTETHDSSDSELEWEDVEEIHTERSPEKKLQDVSIELPQDAIPGLSRNKMKKKQFDWKGYIERQIRRMNKEQRESLHKAHLLTLLACVLYRSRVCNDPDLAGLALSLTPPEIVRQRRWDLSFLSKVVKWFQSKFPLVLDEEESEDKNTVCTSVTLGRRLQEGKVKSAHELVWLFVVMMRMLKVDTRLVISLQPIPLKEPSRSKSKQNKSPGVSRQKKPPKSATKSRGGTSKTPASKTAKQTRNVKQSKPGKGEKMPESSDDSSTERSSLKTSDLHSRRQQKTKNSRPRRHASKTKPMVESSESDDKESSDSDYVPEFSTDMNNTSSKESEREVEEITISDDSDLEIVDVSKLRIKKKSGKPNRPPSRKIISDDSDESVVEVSSKGGAVSEQWVEAYIVEEERWVTVDVVSGLVDRPELVEQQVVQPMVYVVGVDTEGSVKDVTKRYAAGWMTSTRMLREDRHGTWWTDTLRLYSSSDKHRSKKEDIELHSKLLQKPLPTTIRDFKDHPLYMLRRHLLKYEAIYPETAAVLGYCKGEPVYARECVHQLHTRDKWLQEARVVRPGEVPYKMVKHNRPDMVKRKMERQGIFTTGHVEEPTVPLFGRWQTEDYMPPLAVDGKVPRNDYGNVDLYLPSMLPVGTVHLQIPGLERVARKLDIDCAPAVVGFDFHSGWSHPVKDGYIVCEEHKDVLLAAWEEDRQNREQKAQDKREKRALDNWRKLTKALLISQRLKRRYQIQNESKVKSSLEGEDIDDEDDADEASDRAVDVEKSWPRRDFSQEATSSKVRQSRGKKRQKEDAHLFPFEKI